MGHFTPYLMATKYHFSLFDYTYTMLLCADNTNCYRHKDEKAQRRDGEDGHAAFLVVTTALLTPLDFWIT